MKSVLLVKYGEICLRGKNRAIFERKLQEDLRRKLPEGFIVRREMSRLCVEPAGGECECDGLIPVLTKVLGLIGVSPCIKLETYDLRSLCESGLFFIGRAAKAKGGGRFSFKVSTKRADKAFPVKSQEVSAAVGECICEGIPEARVDLDNPEVTLYIELRNHAYIYCETIKCAGGLPGGSSGKGLLLLSGGIDSPVAGFMAARRGVGVSAAYFHSPPYVSERSKQKVIDLAKTLAAYTEQVKLFVVPFTEAQLFLKERVQPEKLTILLKRAMLIISGMIARDEGCHCLLTGDSIGQVASQTMQSILAQDSASPLPVIRPLSGMDKQEIIDRAIGIGTYAISIRPYEDCCTLFVADHPETKPKASVIEGIEARLPGYGELLKKARDAAEVLEIT